MVLTGAGSEEGRYRILFEPVDIGPVTSPNRFYAVPHATGHGWAQPEGAIALRAMKAEGGWGVVAAQMTEIAPDSDLANHPMDRLWDERDLPVHRAQVAAIKEHDALAAIELAHGGMRARNYTSGLPVPGPSHLRILRPEIPIQARAMDLADIRAFREAHKRAAGNAKEAGYDILYVYAAHDLSLLSHFLSIRTNHRTDAYGGSLENRMRLLREVLEDTLEVAKDERAVALRFSVAEPGKAIGLAHDGEGRDVVEALAELPDLWDVNISGWPEDSQTARFAEEGFQLPFTDFVKSVTSKPVVGVGRFTTPDLMVSLVRKKRLDLIGAARPSIADPFLPAKIRAGRTDDIRECIGCNICVSMDGYGVPLRCTQNPTIAEEWRRGWHPESVPVSDKRLSCLIVGAGPAGLECAWTLLRAGHHVTIAEARAEAGGRVAREAALPGLGAWRRVRDHRLHQIQRHAEADLYLSSRLTADDVESFDAHAVVIATGSRWRRDGVGAANPLPLSLGDAVLTPDDIMDGTSGSIEPGSVIVYDDDHFYMASLIAEKLASDGHRVAYVTPLPMVATWTDLTLEQSRIIRRLTDLGVALHVNVTMVGERQFKNTLTGEAIDLHADRLVTVGARLPDDELYRTLNERLVDRSIWTAGDCHVPGTIQAAVLSGHRTARLILGDASAAEAFHRDIPVLS
ncbi:MAG: FAD-dependent oxidoreductase [Pseudomonadota bacterium]